MSVQNMYVFSCLRLVPWSLTTEPPGRPFFCLLYKAENAMSKTFGGHFKRWLLCKNLNDKGIYTCLFCRAQYDLNRVYLCIRDSLPLCEIGSYFLKAVGWRYSAKVLEREVLLWNIPQVKHLLSSKVVLRNWLAFSFPRADLRDAVFLRREDIRVTFKVYST